MEATLMAVAFGGMFICSTMGPNLSELEFRTFVRRGSTIGFSDPAEEALSRPFLPPD